MEDIEKLVTHIHCEPLSLRDLTSYIKAMRISVPACLEDMNSVRSMKFQLVLEDLHSMPNINLGINSATALPMTKQMRAGFYHLPNEYAKQVISREDMDVLSKLNTPAEILIAALFVARMLLSIPRIRMIFMMMDGSLDNGNRPAVILQKYALRLESIAVGDQKKLAAFIHEHPKRVAFTLLEQSVHTLESEKRGACRRSTTPVAFVREEARTKTRGVVLTSKKNGLAFRIEKLHEFLERQH